MEKIRISYKGGLGSLRFSDLLEKLDFNKIDEISAGETFNIWQDSPMNFRLEFRQDELFFIFKNRKQPKWEDHFAKLEGERKINLSDIDHFLRIFEIFELSEVATTLASYTKIIYQGYEIYVRFSSELGYFWEITCLLDREDEQKINLHAKNILKIVELLNLTYWTEEDQQKTIKDSKFNFISTKYSIKEGWSALKLKIQKYLYETRHYEQIDKSIGKKRIIDLLEEIDNDFSLIERFYFEITGNQLVSTTYDKPFNALQKLYEKVICNTKYSIIVPFFNDSQRIAHLLLSLVGQKLPSIIKNGMEIIIIDDGSIQEEKDKLSKIIIYYEKKLPLNLVSLKNNSGRSNARNVGGLVSKGEVLFFLDGDVVLPSNYILENLFIYKLFPKVVTVSMKENISIHDERLSLLENRGYLHEQDINPSDFRMGKTIHPDGKGFNKMNHDPLVSVHISCIDQTDFFKNFGNGITCGVWELPYMVITHNTMVPKKGFLAVNGFSKKFKGWGLEDSFFGAMLISVGYYIIPSMKTPILHLNHPVRELSEEDRQKDFINNIEVYKELISEII